MYGLSDASRQWYLRGKEELTKLGATVSNLDPALFSWVNKDEVSGIICLYVDDFLWAGTKVFESEVIGPIMEKFLIGSCASGSFKYIGLNISRDSKGCTTIDQLEYIQSMETFSLTLRGLH